jgi:hypothetical protein
MEGWMNGTGKIKKKLKKFWKNLKKIWKILKNPKKF